MLGDVKIVNSYHSIIQKGLISAGEELIKQRKKIRKVFRGEQKPLSIVEHNSKRVVNYKPDIYFILKNNKKLIFEILDSEEEKQDIIIADIIRSFLVENVEAIIFIFKGNKKVENRVMEALITISKGLVYKGIKEEELPINQRIKSGTLVIKENKDLKIHGKKEAIRLKGLRSKYLSDYRKGKPPWNKGIKIGYSWNKGLTKETDERLKIQGERLKEKVRKGLANPGFKKGYTPYNKGKKQTQKWMEMRKKLILPKKDSTIEVKIQNFLKELEIEFITHKYIKEIEHGYQCDIFISSMNLIIECDGDYWHNYPEGRDIDKIRTKEMEEKELKVLRLWEREIRKMNLKNFKEKLQ